MEELSAKQAVPAPEASKIGEFQQE